jgi:hypothetical protein
MDMMEEDVNMEIPLRPPVEAKSMLINRDPKAKWHI